MSDWKTDFSDAPSGHEKYFFVRPVGMHPAYGQPYLPTLVFREEGKFYTSENHLDPVYFGQDEPEDSPLRTTLEWTFLPSAWGYV